MLFVFICNLISFKFGFFIVVVVFIDFFKIIYYDDDSHG